MSPAHRMKLGLSAATALVAAGLCTASAQTVAPMPAAGTAMAVTGQPDADMAKVLGALQALEPKPIETLSPAEARRQPSAADAVKKVVKDDGIKADPHAGIKVDNSFLADMGKLKLRYYAPENATKGSKLPIVVYFRGGGWVIADLDTYDATPSALARKLGAAVVSVDYPLAPENKFPAAHDEAIEAYKYILGKAEGWGYDPNRIAIVGESAGGNLAVNTAIAARDQNLTKPMAVVSVYPVAATTLDTPSKKEQANAKPLNTPMLSWFFSHVLPNDGAKTDPRLDLVSAKLDGLPPTTIILAELDPLRSDGEMLGDKLKAAGVNTTVKLYPGVTHEFFGMDAVVDKAKEAQDFAVAQINAAMGGSTMGSTGPAK